jgi:hypothetical protein
MSIAISGIGQRQLEQKRNLGWNGMLSSKAGNQHRISEKLNDHKYNSKNSCGTRAEYIKRKRR